MSSDDYLCKVMNDKIHLQKSFKTFLISMDIRSPFTLIHEKVLYVIGGENKISSLADILSVEIGLIEAMTCRMSLRNCSLHIGNLIHPRIYHSSCIHNSVIYTLGGDDSNSKYLEKFDILTKLSAIISIIPARFIFPGCCVVNDKIVIVGGSANDQINENFYFYDLKSKLWKIDINFITEPPKSPIVLGLSNRLIIAFGGVCNFRMSNYKVVIFDLKTGIMKEVNDSFIPGYDFRWIQKAKNLVSVYYTGKFHTVNIDRVRRAVEFEMFYKEIWERRKTLLFFAKFAEEKTQKLPGYLIREILKLL